MNLFQTRNTGKDIHQTQTRNPLENCQAVHLQLHFVILLLLPLNGVELEMHLLLCLHIQFKATWHVHTFRASFWFLQSSILHQLKSKGNIMDLKEVKCLESQSYIGIKNF